MLTDKILNEFGNPQRVEDFLKDASRHNYNPEMLVLYDQLRLEGVRRPLVSKIIQNCSKNKIKAILTKINELGSILACMYMEPWIKMSIKEINKLGLGETERLSNKFESDVTNLQLRLNVKRSTAYFIFMNESEERLSTAHDRTGCPIELLYIADLVVDLDTAFAGKYDTAYKFGKMEFLGDYYIPKELYEYIDFKAYGESLIKEDGKFICLGDKFYFEKDTG